MYRVMSVIECTPVWFIVVYVHGVSLLVVKTKIQ